MLLIIFLGLIVNLALVSGDCDVGNHIVKNFDYPEASGTWYVAYHSNNTIENSLDCVEATYERPNGNTSSISLKAFNKSNNSTITVYGKATNWDRSGVEENFGLSSIWNGRYYVVAIHYKYYAILKLCSTEANEVLVYVAFRTCRPNKQTERKVEKVLRNDDIDINQLVKWRTCNCQQAGSSAEEGRSD